MISINRSRGFSIISAIIASYALSPKPCYSITVPPRNTKTKVRTHNKFIRRALITTGKLKRSVTRINKINTQYYPPNVASFSTLDEEEYNFNPFDAMLPKTASGVLLASLPITIPVVAFNTFDGTSDTFHRWIVLAGSGNPNFNMEEVSIEANGIVVQSIALLFATMASVTVSSLRERLRELRIHLNNEASILQELIYFIDTMSISASTRDICMNYVEDYTDRLILESQSRTHYNIPLLNSELNMLRQEICLPKEQNDDEKNASVLPYVNTAISELKEYRSNRIALLQSNFPIAHYVTLAILALSICVIFLIDSSTKTLATDVIILKMFWSMTLGTFTILSTTCYDLRDPFRGSYAVCTRSFKFLRDKLHARRLELNEKTGGIPK